MFTDVLPLVARTDARSRISSSDSISDGLFSDMTELMGLLEGLKRLCLLPETLLLLTSVMPLLGRDNVLCKPSMSCSTSVQPPFSRSSTISPSKPYHTIHSIIGMQERLN